MCEMASQAFSHSIGKQKTLKGELSMLKHNHNILAICPFVKTVVITGAGP